jgi:two-component system phosphate regulon sensor histidine kinase PhoR
VRRASPALGKLLGFTADPVGQRPSVHIPVPTFQYVCDEAARTREVSERPLSLHGRELLIRALPSEDGSGVLGVVLDVTSMGTADRMRRDFAANVSHELRTPITAIVGFAEALEADKALVPAELTPMIEAILRNAERLRLLVEDVLSLSRIESRPVDLVLEPARVGGLVSAVVERFAAVAERRQVALNSGGALDAEAWVNHVALEHALSNLVDNALKYTPAGGRVDVEVARLDDAVEVWVRDTGPGIDPIHHSRIFERFYRVDPGRSRNLGGTGLGLALVKHLCASMRAEVRLVSELGQGCRFGIRLPVGTID